MLQATRLVLIFAALSTLNLASATTCKPIFNHQDDKVAKNNRCTKISFQPSNTEGSGVIIMDGDTKGSCAYTSAVQCGNTEIRMKDISAIDFKVDVPPRKCGAKEWIAVYMFPWCGQPGGCWAGGQREVDFVETTGSNGPGGFASNWGGLPKQAAWTSQTGPLQVKSGAQQHITFTSRKIISGEASGTYQWDIRVCGASASKCDDSNQVWHAYREKGPAIFDESMMIVIDNWGVNNPPQPGCTLKITDMLITKY
ncbi:hypothetical protein ACJJI3_00110 [Microbulbifer sp. ZKSA004]|uniref:hypothetical protein n=1 Tax=Microbulbifer sp. ZKSA004 TaxID=3243389 RepID=UPI00403A0C38